MAAKGATKPMARRLSAVSLAVVVVGAVLVASALAASAAGSGPSISVSPDTGLSQGTAVLMTGKGFTKNAPQAGAFMECSTAAGQPTVSVTGFTTPVPVSCSAPAAGEAKVSKSGNVGYTGTQITTGTVGPPQVGADTGGTGDAATDAADFPCPPYPAQVAVGAGCEMVFLDDAGQMASQPLQFTTTSTPTTTSSTTTTTAPCNAQPATMTGTPPNGTATVTVNPATCLEPGTKVTITATGLLPYNGTTNLLGTVLECNDDTGQPTVPLAGRNFPVSCTGALANDFVPNASGTLSTTFSVVVGMTGPPTTGTDSAGNDASTDAAKYPCPPLPAQTADKCVIAVGDIGGDKVIVPISFNPGVVAGGASTSPGGASGGSTTTKPVTTKASATTTKASSGALAFTGSGPGLWWLGLIGVTLMVAGALVLIMVDEPRRVLRVVRGR
jgi:hypothetical protein